MMNIRSVRLFVIFAWISSMLSTTLYAGEAQFLSQKTYRELTSAQKLLDTGNAKKAISNLKELLDESRQKPYELALVQQTLARAYIGQDDYRSAIPHLKHSLELEALPADSQQRTRYNLAQLYMATERFTDALDVLEVWFTHASKPKAEAYVMMGRAYLQLKRYQEAIEPLRMAIKTNPAPKESWYQSLLAAHSELEQFKQCASLLHTMVQLFPDRASYWRQLSGIQMTREKYEDALSVMELAYLQKHLETQQDLLNLAQLYMFRNAPYKAGVLIENEIKRGRLKRTTKNWEQAANAWLQARETTRAAAALEQAVKTSRKVDLNIKLAQLYIENEQRENAIDRLQKILKFKRLKDDDAGQIWLLLGVANMNENTDHKAALAAFSEAIRFNKTKKDAAQWLSYLDYWQ